MEKKSEPKISNLKECENTLRGVATKESILNGIKRIDVFKGSEALTHLMSNKKMKVTDAHKVMTTLLESHQIAKVRAEGEQYALDVSYDFNINHEYIWIAEESKTFRLAIGVVGIIFALTIAMFPLWPRPMKVASGYVVYLLFGILIALISISVLRLVVYLLVKIATGRSFWIFPNFYEECGILESFVPLYGWEEQAGAEAQKRE